jgi:hypothetical protein
MEIIILEGDQSKGKTTTMGVVLVALLINGATLNRITPVQSPSGMDFEADLTTANGKKVAIYSKGDNLSNCNTAINTYSQRNYDVLVIAYRTKQTPLTIPQKDTTTNIPKTVASSAVSEVQSNANDGTKIVIRI